MKSFKLMQKLGLVACMLFSMQVSALIIDADDFDPSSPSGILLAVGNETSQNAINSIIDPTYLDISTELYRANVVEIPEQPFETLEEYSLAANYSTEWTGDDPNGAIVTYDGGAIIDPTHLLVKDGNQQPAWYLFDLSAWDGVEALELVNFWVGPGGGISHISLYGSTGTTEVPEPGSLALLALGLFGLVAGRRTKLTS